MRGPTFVVTGPSRPVDSAKIAQGARTLSPDWEQSVDNSGGDVGWRRELHPSSEGVRLRPRDRGETGSSIEGTSGCGGFQTSSRWSGGRGPQPLRVVAKAAARESGKAREAASLAPHRARAREVKLVAVSPSAGSAGHRRYSRRACNARGEVSSRRRPSFTTTRCPSGAGRGRAVAGCSQGWLRAVSVDESRRAPGR